VRLIAKTTTAQGRRVKCRLDRRARAAIREQARGEIEVRYVGRLVKRGALLWQQTRVRPFIANLR
jgi:hypothetical protein